MRNPIIVRTMCKQMGEAKPRESKVPGVCNDVTSGGVAPRHWSPALHVTKRGDRCKEHWRPAQVPSDHTAAWGECTTSGVYASGDLRQQVHIGVCGACEGHSERYRFRPHRGHVREIRRREFPPELVAFMPGEPEVWPFDHRVARNYGVTRETQHRTVVSWPECCRLSITELFEHATKYAALTKFSYCSHATTLSFPDIDPAIDPAVVTLCSQLAPRSLHGAADSLTGVNGRAFKTSALLLAAGALTATLTSCAPDVPMQAAEDANNPECANVIVRLPSIVDGLDRRYTNAQSTGAWGNPESVLLHCGIEPSGPTTDECVTVNDVDWIIDDSRAPLYRFEAYGRSPGLEVIVDASQQISGTNVIAELGSSVGVLPQTRHCTSIIDELDDTQFGDTPDTSVKDDSAEDDDARLTEETAD